MSRATASVVRRSHFSADVVFSAVGLVAVVESWRRLKKGICDPYRPELHYMRGPGPKWRETHGHAVPSRSMFRRQQDCAAAEEDRRRTIATWRAIVADRLAEKRKVNSNTQFNGASVVADLSHQGATMQSPAGRRGQT